MGNSVLETGVKIGSTWCVKGEPILGALGASRLAS